MPRIEIRGAAFSGKIKTILWQNGCPCEIEDIRDVVRRFRQGISKTVLQMTMKTTAHLHLQ